MSSLRDLLTTHLETTTDARDDDARGWLLRTGVVDLVEPFVTTLPADPGDLTRFAGLDGATAVLLLERLSSARLADRQNHGPTLGTVLGVAAAHPDEVELGGYLVGPGRADERITVEGLDLYGVGTLLAPDRSGTPITAADVAADVRRMDPDATAMLVWGLVQHLGVDDATGPPDLVTERVNPWRPNETCWSLWWD